MKVFKYFVIASLPEDWYLNASLPEQQDQYLIESIICVDVIDFGAVGKKEPIAAV